MLSGIILRTRSVTASAVEPFPLDRCATPLLVEVGVEVGVGVEGELN